MEEIKVIRDCLSQLDCPGAEQSMINVMDALRKISGEKAVESSDPEAEQPVKISKNSLDELNETKSQANGLARMMLFKLILSAEENGFVDKKDIPAIIEKLKLIEECEIILSGSQNSDNSRQLTSSSVVAWMGSFFTRQGDTENGNNLPGEKSGSLFNFSGGWFSGS